MKRKLPYGLQAEVARRATAVLAERYPDVQPPMRVDDSQVSRLLRGRGRTKHGELIIRVMYMVREEMDARLKAQEVCQKVKAEIAAQVTAEMGAK